MKTVIEMAREAGFMAITNDEPDVGAWYECFTSEIERFAELVRTDEREACAKLVEVPAEWEDWEVDCGEQGREMCNNLAAAIRARGENT